MATNSTDRQLVWVVLAIAATLILLPAFSMGFGIMGTGSMMGATWDHGTWGVSDGASGWMFVVGAGVQLLFVAVLVGAGYRGYRALTSRAGSAGSALVELRSAYARGELDDEEFERRRARLESGQ